MGANDTTFGWDASNYDDQPTVRDGIDYYTHKAGEGHHSYYDREYAQSLNNAKNLGIPVLGAYFVNHPGSVADQVDWFVEILNQDTPWWREHPCFILQIDAEKFDYMPSAPTLAEIQAFGDRLVSVHGVKPAKVIAYAPQWLYGNSLTGLTYRLWASAYGGNPVGHYRSVYPGNNDIKRWQAYSGQTPLFLQYGSNTNIGNQTTCDANAYRGTLTELMTVLGSEAEETEMYPVFVYCTDGTIWLSDGTLRQLVTTKQRDDMAYWYQRGGRPMPLTVTTEVGSKTPQQFTPADMDIWGMDIGTFAGGLPGPGGPHQHKFSGTTGANEPIE